MNRYRPLASPKRVAYSVIQPLGGRCVSTSCLLHANQRSSFATSACCRRRTTMRIRPVHAEELDLFVEAGSPEHREEVVRYLQSMFAAGSMRPEWCFVAQQEEEDRTLGRVAFWTLPGMEEPFALVLLDLAWDGEYMGVGTRLLEDVLDKARALGAEEIEHVVDDPPMRPQFQVHPEGGIDLREGVGFPSRRETRRFGGAGGRPPAVPRRLSFRML